MAGVGWCGNAPLAASSLRACRAAAVEHTTRAALLHWAILASTLDIISRTSIKGTARMAGFLHQPRPPPHAFTCIPPPPIPLHHAVHEGRVPVRSLLPRSCRLRCRRSRPARRGLQRACRREHAPIERGFSALQHRCVMCYKSRSSLILTRCIQRASARTRARPRPTTRRTCSSSTTRLPRPARRSRRSRAPAQSSSVRVRLRLRRLSRPSFPYVPPNYVACYQMLTALIFPGNRDDPRRHCGHVGDLEPSARPRHRPQRGPFWPRDAPRRCPQPRRYPVCHNLYSFLLRVNRLSQPR
jgi:hypothetical protein